MTALEPLLQRPLRRALIGAAVIGGIVAISAVFALTRGNSDGGEHATTADPHDAIDQALADRGFDTWTVRRNSKIGEYWYTLTGMATLREGDDVTAAVIAVAVAPGRSIDDRLAQVIDVVDETVETSHPRDLLASTNTRTVVSAQEGVILVQLTPVDDAWSRPAITDALDPLRTEILIGGEQEPSDDTVWYVLTGVLIIIGIAVAVWRSGGRHLGPRYGLRSIDNAEIALREAESRAEGYGGFNAYGDWRS